jgi:hypothetical protein
METSITYSKMLENLLNRVRRLISTAQSLANLFEQEANRLKSEVEVANLKKLYSIVHEEVGNKKRLETDSRLANNLIEGGGSIVRLVAGLVTMSIQDEAAQAFSRELLSEPRKETPFGTVVIRVGPSGIPDDVEVVCISELARQSERDELTVVDELLAKGNFLLDEKSFSVLVEIIADEILAGNLSLPVLPNRIIKYKERTLLQLGLVGN